MNANDTMTQSAPAPPALPPKKHHVLRNILIGVGGTTAALIGIGVAASTGSNPAPAPSQTAAPPAAAPAAPTTAPPAAPAAPAAPQYTVSQQSAIQDAESYLQAEPGFSKLGLIEQLQYDKFSRADARFAVNHIQVNWRQQAAAAARDYMQSVGGFSYGGLVAQLEYDKFTPAQAAYGAHAAGL